MPATRVAVVDLGTNSTRLLVADVEDGAVDELERRTTVTRLGQGVDASGRLADDAMQCVFDALADYCEAIVRLGATTVVAVATSAVRDAENGEHFRAALRERFDIDARTIAGDEEARLTFLGATANRRRHSSDDGTLVIDIGGGSTEYVIGHPHRDPDFHVSTSMGSVRHTERHLAHDPPRDDELQGLRADAARIVGEHVPAPLREQTTSGIAVAGTATSLAAIDLELDPYDPRRVHGHLLGLDEAERILADLASKTTQQRRPTTGLHPDRAPTIVAGAAILVESMRAFGLDRIEVSEHDILHGAALAAAQA